MKNKYNLNSFNGSNDLNKLILVFVLGLVVATYLKTVIILSIFIIFLSMSLIDLIVHFHEFNSILSLKILETQYNKSMRCLSIVMENHELIDDNEELFQAIHNTIQECDEFINFGNEKIIILSCILENHKEVNLHSNVLINNLTSFEEYYDSISDDMDNYSNLQYGYNSQLIIKFIVKAWDVSNLKNVRIKTTHNAITIERKSVRSYSTVASTFLTKKDWSKGLITPLSLFDKKGKLMLDHPKAIFTMDIETIKLNGFQTPIAISSCGPPPKGGGLQIIYN
jgi:hypothetical protein